MARSSETLSTTTIEDLHPDVLASALRRMDGPTLAAFGCSASLFHSLSTDPSIWRHLCLQAWPSLRLLPTFLSLSPRSFFADTFPFPDTDTIPDTVSSSSDNADKPLLPERVFSAVDIRYAGVPVFSRVVQTETSCPWFLGSVFRIDALDRRDPPVPAKPVPGAATIGTAGVELSWAVVDAATGRAVNVSSRRPVAVDRHWYTGEALVRFVTVLGGCAVSIVVTWEEEEEEEAGAHVREVSMTVEDADGIAVSGRESLGILTAAMRGRRRRRRRRRRRKGGNYNGGEEEEEEEQEAKRKYEEYIEKKRMRKERKMRREGMLDLCCTSFGAMVSLAFFILLAFR